MEKGEAFNGARGEGSNGVREAFNGEGGGNQWSRGGHLMEKGEAFNGETAP